MAGPVVRHDTIQMADHANQPNTSRQSGVVPAGFQYDVVETSE
jgi:hypothetical protein